MALATAIRNFQWGGVTIEAGQSCELDDASLRNLERKGIVAPGIAAPLPDKGVREKALIAAEDGPSLTNQLRSKFNKLKTHDS